MQYRLIEYDCRLNAMFKATKQSLSYSSISKRGLRSAVSEALLGTESTWSLTARTHELAMVSVT